MRNKIGFIFYNLILFFLCIFIYVFLNLHVVAICCLVIVIVYDIAFLTLCSIKFKYYTMGGKKALIYANIDNSKLLKLYYGNTKEKEIIKKIYIIIKEQIKYGPVKTFGDTYVFVYKYYNKSEIISLINKINNEIALISNDTVFNVTVSFGIQLCNKENYEINENKAALACNNAKKQEMNLYSFFDDQDGEEQLREKRILDSLARALKNNEFQIFYQPKFDYKQNKIVGSEALARLVQNGEIIPAKDFIDIAEKYGVTISLDKYVLKEVCKKINELKKNNIPFNTISINVSRNTLCEESMMEYYESMFKKYDIKKNDIELEVTERSISGYNTPFVKIRELSKKFNVSIDDFGVGNSSLSMLMEDKVKTIKIDRQFVIDKSESGKIILDNMIKLIQSLGFEIVAEGVETEEQKEYLKVKGCNVIQGYYFSKPLSFEDYKNELVKWGDNNGS